MAGETFLPVLEIHVFSSPGLRTPKDKVPLVDDEQQPAGKGHECCANLQGSLESLFWYQDFQPQLFHAPTRRNCWSPAARPASTFKFPGQLRSDFCGTQWLAEYCCSLVALKLSTGTFNSGIVCVGGWTSVREATCLLALHSTEVVLAD